MAVHPLEQARNSDAVRQARIFLAAAHRLAVFHDLDEGIDNHFTVTLPGADDRYLILPFGLHWSEARASDMIVFDESGATLEGKGDVERSAQCIHAPIHRITGAKVVLHTHQTWAVALNMLKDNRLLPASQTAAYYHGQVAYDDHYAGTTVAYTSAVLGGNRNVGLMLVITAGTAGEVFSLYVGVAQIPMYFAPLLLAPLLRLSRA